MSNSQQIQQYVNQAMSLLQQGEYTRALTIFNALEKAGMQDFRLFRAMGSAYERLHKPSEASEYFTKTLRLNAAQPDVVLSLARLHTAMKNWQQAQSWYQKLLTLTSDGEAALSYVRFLLMDEVAQPKSALTVLSGMAGEIASSAQYYLLTARAQGGIGDEEGQQQTLQQALQKYGSSKEIHAALAWLYKANGHSEKAEQHFEMAANHPQATDTDIENLAIFYIGNDTTSKARVVLEKAVAAHPGSRKLMKLMASLRFELGEPDYLSHYEKVREDAANPALVFDYLDQCLNTQQLEQAEKVLSSLHDAHQSSPFYRQRQALLHYQREEYVQAIDLLNPLISDEPQNHLLLDLLTKTLLATGELEDAQHYVSRLLSLTPDDQYYWALQATTWRLAGDERYAWLCDYEQLVKPVSLQCPTGYASLNDFLAELRATLEKLHITKRQPLEQSLVEGTQTTGSLFERRHPVIQSLRSALHNTAADALASLQLDKAHPTCQFAGQDFDFATSWSVRLSNQGFHVSHVHPKGWYSSAFYVDVPSSVGAKSRDGWLHLGKPGIATGEVLDAEQWIRPEPGKLALFPSFMWHGTAPFTSEQPRLTVAFDLQKRGAK